MLKLPLNDESLLFYENYQKADNYIPAVVAVLNKCGFGTLYFGVNNQGECVGTSINRNTIASVIKDFEEGIAPRIYPSIVTLPFNTNILKISFEGHDKPYKYKSKYYIRDYKDIRTLDYQSITKELNVLDKDNFKDDEIINFSLRYVDEQLIRNTFEKSINTKKYSPKNKQFNLKKVLLNWGLLKNNNSTRALNFLYSKKLPLSLTINIFDNEKNSNLIESKFTKGNIISLLEFSLMYLKKSYTEKFKIKNNSYPAQIIEELVVNAFLHANYNYSNEIKINLSPYKIAVLSPGKFVDGYLPEDFAFSHARPVINNKLIGKILAYEDYASLNGKGFKFLFENKKETKPYEMKQNGNHLEITYFIYTDKNKYLTVDKAVLSVITEKPFAKAEDIGKKIGKTRRTVQTILKELKEKNLIVRKGSKKTGYWIVNK